MVVRKPVVAGRFYPGNESELKKEVGAYLRAGESTARPGDGRPFAVMLPHAGHVFCGNVIGRTLAGLDLPSRLVVLCPNHTGYGRPISLWPEGVWITPLGAVSVDANLAMELLKSNGGYEPDTHAHLGEHSIEVLLPFLQEQTENLCIVPICVGTQNSAILEKAGKAMAGVLQDARNADVGLIVSSDMNHYENEKATIAKDEMALQMVLKEDPKGLLEIVNREHISMCGAGPMALALYAAKALGGVKVEIVAHETSGTVSGDYDHTVGYAGLRLYPENARAKQSSAIGL